MAEEEVAHLLTTFERVTDRLAKAKLEVSSLERERDLLRARIEQVLSSRDPDLDLNPTALAETVAFVESIDRNVTVADVQQRFGLQRAAAGLRLARAARDGLIHRVTRGVYRGRTRAAVPASKETATVTVRSQFSPVPSVDVYRDRALLGGGTSAASLLVGLNPAPRSAPGTSGLLDVLVPSPVNPPETLTVSGGSKVPELLLSSILPGLGRTGGSR